MAETNMELIDAINVLRGGHVPQERGCSHENGTWRYRLESAVMAVVVAFLDDGRMVIVTAFRLGG